MIVGASDRMLSAPDIKFEPPQMKIFQFFSWCVALIAGDPFAQMSMCNATMKTIRIRGEKGRPVSTVQEVAEIFSEAFSAQRRSLAENRYLKPIGLDANSLIDRQQDMRNEVVADLMQSLQRSPLDCETIITGADDTGHHIFVVNDPGDLLCADAVSFASIGSGKHHADSQFMMARHTKNTPFHTALLQTFAAKKRAEVTPTVGEMTDLFYIGSDRAFHELSQSIHDHLSSTFKKLEENVMQANSDADAAVAEFVTELTKPQSQAQQESEPLNQATKKRKPKGRRGQRK